MKKEHQERKRVRERERERERANSELEYIPLIFKMVHLVLFLSISLSLCVTNSKRTLSPYLYVCAELKLCASFEKWDFKVSHWKAL